MSDDKSVKMIATKDLESDRNNPRLAEYGILANAADEEVIATLWDAMDVMELVQSIAASGFFPHEQLIVAREGKKNIGFFVEECENPYTSPIRRTVMLESGQSSWKSKTTIANY